MCNCGNTICDSGEQSQAYSLILCIKCVQYYQGIRSSYKQDEGKGITIKFDYNTSLIWNIDCKVTVRSNK